jgi:GT2 family glycosyltransferase
MKKNPKAVIDVVIGCAGRFDLLEKCLIAIYEYATVPISVTVIDDASDKQKKMLYPHLFNGSYSSENVVQFNTRRLVEDMGYGFTNNVGAKIGSAPLICFISDDVVITPDFFNNIMLKMVDQTVGICGTKLLFPLDSIDPKRPAGKVQHIGIALDVQANAIHPLMGWSPNNPKTCKTRECLAVTGALLVVRRDVFRAVGGFDPLYGKGYWEDVDLCLKVRQFGYRIIIDTNLIAYHYAGASSAIDKTFSQDFQTNRMLFQARWGNTGMLTFDSWSYG